MRVTSQHWEVFLNLCERNPNLITSKFNGAQGKAEGNALWRNVATKLNGLGLGEKSVVEWRRAVTDWKSKVKSKASKIRQSAYQTGGGPINAPTFTPLEERLIVLMGKKGFEGDQGVRELGFASGEEHISNAPLEVSSIFIEETYENVLQEIEDCSEQPSQTINIQNLVGDGFSRNKHKHDEETPSTSQSQRQNEEPKMYLPKKGKRRLEEVQVSSDQPTMTRLIKFQNPVGDGFSTNIRKQDEETPSISQEHNYCEEPNMTLPKKQRIKKKRYKEFQKTYRT